MEAAERPRAHSTYRRRYQKRKPQEGSKWTRWHAIQLIVCLFILLAAAALRLLFPETVSKLRDGVSHLICGDVDYQAAFETVGKGLSGDLQMGEALKEAGIYAFGYSSEDETQVFSGSSRKDTTETEASASDTAGTTTAASQGSKATTAGASDTSADTAQPETEESTVSDEEEKTEAVAEAFKERQADYTDLPVPTSVTYDYVPIGLDCATPLVGAVSSGFGYREHPDTKTIKFHYGTDITADAGSVITAFADGTVTGCGNDSDLGLYMVIRHDGGVVTEYGHCSKLLVTEGSEVKEGDPIAVVGTTGNATGICLHFMILVNGEYVNPEYYI